MTDTDYLIQYFMEHSQKASDDNTVIDEPMQKDKESAKAEEVAHE